MNWVADLGNSSDQGAGHQFQRGAIAQVITSFIMLDFDQCGSL